VQSNLYQRILSLMDLTSLNETDTAAQITLLCDNAIHLSVAAVCLYPQFVSQAVEQLGGSCVRIATVANFPEGKKSLAEVILSIEHSIRAGAHEIDVVFPYEAYLAGRTENACQFVTACKTACGNATLKVILETGIYPSTEKIFQASHDILLAGADFLKTSTGKISVGATLPAVTAMLAAIQQLSGQLDRPLGLKVAGGIKTIAQAKAYLDLACQYMTSEWISSRTFRFGASQVPLA